MTNCIIIGASQTAIWTSWPDKDFVFENNIISHCKHVWIKNMDNPTVYTMKNCITVNNEIYQGIAKDNGVDDSIFELKEIDVVKTGELKIREMENHQEALPKDYLHILPGTLGAENGAGLFKITKNQIN